jgi:D-glycero-beta-D-manno-heptose 1-phosphate adenylyltransferase
LKRADLLKQKIYDRIEMGRLSAQWKLLSRTIVFTNGVFDILHEGHIYSLSKAASEADYLVVGINSDSSVKKLKGESRPVNKQDSRALVLASLAMVDAVVIFDEETPLELIKTVMPDVLVKGGDYTEDQIVGAKEVKASGGRVVVNPILEGFSTTKIIQDMKNNK